ncbi:MAG: T9SS type A sorting domain-containing protein, partial [Mucilaginibacter sp.]|nr:T9SS type A sorting domain-containing protein [Mucilaginibacter sp.]
LGTSPIISATVGVNDNIPMQYDFRSVYASVLKNWFCVSDDVLNNIMLNNFQPLPCVKDTAPCPSVVKDIANVQAGTNLISNYPNPFTGSTTINFESQGGHALIQIFDSQGHLVGTLIDGIADKGSHKITFDSQGHPPGPYYARLQNGSLQQVRTMILAR